MVSLTSLFCKWVKTEGGPERLRKTKGKNLYHLDKNLFPFLLKNFFINTF